MLVPMRTQGAETDSVVDAMWAAALGTGPAGGGSGGSSTSPASASSTRPPTPAGAAGKAGGGGGSSGGGALSPSESASSTDLAVLYDGPVSEVVAAVQAVVCDYAFSLRAPLPDLEELFFRVIKPHRNTLEYLGVVCAKLELAYARALAREQAAGSGAGAGAGAGPLLPPSLVFDLAAAFAPYIIRPAVWGAAQDAHAKRRAKFLQYRFVLLFWYFLKRKHNLVTRVERNDLNRNSQEVPSCWPCSEDTIRERSSSACAWTVAARPQMLHELLKQRLPRTTMRSVQAAMRRGSGARTGPWPATVTRAVHSFAVSLTVRHSTHFWVPTAQPAENADHDPLRPWNAPSLSAAPTVLTQACPLPPRRPAPPLPCLPSAHRGRTVRVEVWCDALMLCRMAFSPAWARHQGWRRLGPRDVRVGRHGPACDER